MTEKKKKMCAGCDKKDCDNCVEDGGQNFCCQNCCDKSKGEVKEETQVENKDEDSNICHFC